MGGARFRAVLIGVLWFSASAVWAQVQITEIMFDPTVQTGWEGTGRVSSGI
jgi:hypothetical protein